MLIKVTQEHIDQGQISPQPLNYRRHTGCPVALALSAEGIDIATVMHGYFIVEGKAEKIPFPKFVTKNIKKFAGYETVAPFEFEVDYDVN